MDYNATKETKSWVYLFIAMIAFGILGLEFGVLFVSRFIDGRSLSQIGIWPIHWYGAIAHWTLTIIVWLTGVYLITRWAVKNKQITKLVDFKLSKTTNYLTLVAVVIVVITAVIESLISGQEIPQVFLEYRGFVNMYGNNAFIVTVFQVLYYVVEMLLVVIMIVFFQQFGELVFKNKYVPYGSVGLMLTWGMIHFLSHPSGALYVTIWALVPGLLYVYGGKRFFPMYVLLVLGFIV